jgi:Leucine-rich repeat (LRR) protein
MHSLFGSKEIGLLTGLASVSITNSTIDGPIPTEIGNLSKLRRLWLYNNELTGVIPTQLATLSLLEVFEVHNNDVGGTMPNGICLSIEAATYQYKSLTSDCKSQVRCDNCCTECFD